MPVRVKMKTPVAVLTPLAAPGVFITMAASLPRARFPGSSNLQTLLRLVVLMERILGRGERENGGGRIGRGGGGRIGRGGGGRIGRGGGGY